MTKTLQDRMILPGNETIPYIGLGVFQVTEQEFIAGAVEKAIEVGYRLFDTAAVYNNEAIVGQAIASSAVSREELFISSKCGTETLALMKRYLLLSEHFGI